MQKKFHIKQASGSGHKHMIFNVFLGSFGTSFVPFFFESFDNSFPLFKNKKRPLLTKNSLYISFKVQKYQEAQKMERILLE